MTRSLTATASSARRFTRIYGGIEAWGQAPVEERLTASVVLRSYAAWALVEHGGPVDVDYVVGTPTKWANHVRDREPVVHAGFVAMAADLGFNLPEIKRMWATMAKLSVISGTPAAVIADDLYTDSRASYLAAVERRCGNVPKIFGTPVFGLNSVMFHLGRGPAPKRRTRDGNRKPDWDALAIEVPVLAAIMRRYLDQLAVSLRPGSVEAIDTTMRIFGRFIADHHPDVAGAADIGRVHIEAFKPWLASRPGHKGQATLTPTTVGMRLGHLRSFFARIIEWDYPDSPRRVPVLLGDFPIRNRALPRFLDDPSASKLITARNLPDPFDGAHPGALAPVDAGLAHQFPNVPSPIPRRSATSAILLPSSITIATASRLNSPVNERRILIGISSITDMATSVPRCDRGPEPSSGSQCGPCHCDLGSSAAWLRGDYRILSVSSTDLGCCRGASERPLVSGGS